LTLDDHTPLTIRERSYLMPNTHLTIRAAVADDAGALRRLAELDSAPALSGRVLLAELDGAPVAAVSLATGAVTADPFQRSEGAAGLLRRRRYQIMRQGGDVAPARSLLRRLAPAPTPTR
jgi:hypothetical protein